MLKQNVTLALPKDLLKEARMLAISQNTSLSALLVQALTEKVRKLRKYEDARHIHELLLADGFDLGLKESIPWSRDDLYE